MRKVLLVSTSVALATVLFTGCGIKTTEYNVSADNVQTLRAYQDVKLGVSDFTATNKGESSVMCRLAETVSTPKGEPFSEYIKEALISELKMAGNYDTASDLKISGNLNKIYGSTMFGNAYWEVNVTITSSKRLTMLLSHKLLKGILVLMTIFLKSRVTILMI